MSTAGRDQHHAGEPLAIAALAQAPARGAAPSSRPSRSRRAICGAVAKASSTASASSSQREIVPSSKRAAGAAMAGIVEARRRRGRLLPPSGRAPPPWCPPCRSGSRRARRRPGARPGAAQHRDAARLRALADLQLFQSRLAHPIASAAAPFEVREAPHAVKPAAPAASPCCRSIPTLVDRRRGAHHDRHRRGARRARRPRAGGERGRAAGGRAASGRRRIRPHAARLEEPDRDRCERPPHRRARSRRERVDIVHARSRAPAWSALARLPPHAACRS